MAIYYEILAGRYSRLLQKIFSMKGPNPAKQLSGEIMPVFPFPNGVENRFPESWLYYGKAITVSPVAAQFGFLQLRNPLGSGVIAVLHKVTVSEGVSDTIALSITNAAQVDATVANVFGMDSRNTGSSSLIFSSGTQVAAPQFATGLIWQAAIGANAQQDFVVDQIQEIPVLPGLTVRLTAGTVNQALVGTFGWRERPIEDSEKF